MTILAVKLALLAIGTALILISIFLPFEPVLPVQPVHHCREEEWKEIAKKWEENSNRLEATLNSVLDIRRSK